MISVAFEIFCLTGQDFQGPITIYLTGVLKLLQRGHLVSLNKETRPSKYFASQANFNTHLLPAHVTRLCLVVQ